MLWRQWSARSRPPSSTLVGDLVEREIVSAVHGAGGRSPTDSEAHLRTTLLFRCLESDRGQTIDRMQSSDSGWTSLDHPTATHPPIEWRRVPRCSQNRP